MLSLPRRRTAAARVAAGQIATGEEVPAVLMSTSSSIAPSLELEKMAMSRTKKRSQYSSGGIPIATSFSITPASAASTSRQSALPIRIAWRCTKRPLFMCFQPSLVRKSESLRPPMEYNATTARISVEVLASPPVNGEGGGERRGREKEEQEEAEEVEEWDVEEEGYRLGLDDETDLQDFVEEDTHGVELYQKLERLEYEALTQKKRKALREQDN